MRGSVDQACAFARTLSTTNYADLLQVQLGNDYAANFFFDGFDNDANRTAFGNTFFQLRNTFRTRACRAFQRNVQFDPFVGGFLIDGCGDSNHHQAGPVGVSRELEKLRFRATRACA